MTDKEILNKYINLKDSCLNEAGKKTGYGNVI